MTLCCASQGGFLYHWVSGEPLQLSLFKVYAVLYRAPGEALSWPLLTHGCSKTSCYLNEQFLKQSGRQCCLSAGAKVTEETTLPAALLMNL